MAITTINKNFKNKGKDIKYLNKDFAAFRANLIDFTKNYIKEKALIGFEHGYQQKAQIFAFAKKYYPDANIIQVKDLQGRDRYTFIGIGGVLEHEKR